jgi:two-component system, NarL family, nitrate/nitrite response regulator NarL
MFRNFGIDTVLRPAEKKIRILLLDDHTIFRQGLIRLLNNQPGLDLPLDYGSAEEALLGLAAALPDLLLLDVDLGTESGIDFLAQARRNGFRGPVLVLTAGVSKDQEQLLESHGISAILRKDVSIEVLAEHIRAAAESQSDGDFAISSAQSSKVLPGSKRPKPLTSREVEVLRLVLEGHANKQIAHEIGCSDSAVKGIIQQLFQKSGTRTRSQLVRAALEQYRGEI